MKNKNRYTAILLGLLVVGAGSTVFADVMTFGTSDDSWVNGNPPSAGSNYGALTEIRLRHQNDTWGNNYSLAKFDVSALPANIVVNSVRMRFFTRLVSWPGAANFSPVAIFNNTQDWDESTVTFANAPTYGAAAVKTLDHFGLVGFDDVYFTGANTITSGAWLEYTGAATIALVEGWADGSIANYGVSIMATEYVDSDRSFFLQAKENPATSVQPNIVVDYTIIPEPATLSLFGVLGAAMLVVRRKFRK